MNINIKMAVLMVFSSVTLIAQDFQGVATYKTQRKLDIKMDKKKPYRIKLVIGCIIY